MNELIYFLAGIPCAILVGLAMYGAGCARYRHKGYTPIVDHDKNQAELDAEFEFMALRKESTSK